MYGIYVVFYMKWVKRLSKIFHHMSLNYKLHVKFRNEPVFKTKARDNYSSHLLLEHYIAFCGGLCIVLMKHLKIWSQSLENKHNESLNKRDHMLRWWCKSVGGVQIVPGIFTRKNVRGSTFTNNDEYKQLWAIHV